MYQDLLPRGRDGALIDASRQSAWSWVKQAQVSCDLAGQLVRWRRIGAHTLRHSYARHLLLSGIPINFVTRWLGHANLTTTLIYLDLLPDPAGSLAAVP